MTRTDAYSERNLTDSTEREQLIEELQAKIERLNNQPVRSVTSLL